MFPRVRSAADLDEIEMKLRPYRVEMFRRPGVGVWLQGDAASYRKVVSALLRSSLPEKELSDVLCGKMPENRMFFCPAGPRNGGNGLEGLAEV